MRMWPFRPKHTVESVLLELAQGYGAGTVVIPGGEPADDLREFVADAAAVEPAAGDEIVIRVTTVKGPGPRVRAHQAGASRVRQIVIEMTPDEARQLVAGPPTPTE